MKRGLACSNTVVMRLLSFALVFLVGCNSGEPCSGSGCADPIDGSVDGSLDAARDGTVSDADAAAPDGTVDATIDVDSPDVPIMPGDSLIVRPDRLRVVQGFMVCAQIVLRHPDGSEDSVPSLARRVSIGGPNADLVEIGEPEDCAPGEHSLIGVAAGMGVVAIRLDALTYTLPVEVIAAEVRLLNASDSIDIGVGWFHALARASFSVRAYDGMDMPLNAGESVPRWLDFRSADPAIVQTMTTGDPQYPFRVQAVGVGSTAVTLRYTGPVVSAVPAVYSTEVFALGTPSSVRVAAFEPTTGTPNPEYRRTGECRDFVLLGRFTTGGAIYEAPLSTPWQTSGLRVASPNRFCVDVSGDVSVRGCSGGLCALFAQFVPRADIAATRISAVAPPPFAPELSNPFLLCLPLRVELDYTDGTTEEITGADFYPLEVEIPIASAGITERWARPPAEGPPLASLRNAAGHACVEGTNRPLATTVGVTVRAARGIAMFDVDFP
ncbi:MAG: hypothetical protein AAGF12_11050 [Myxococcota bacterium]